MLRRRPELDLLFGDQGRAGTEARQLRIERAARLVAQASERRANFLVEASARLATVLDPTTTVETITELAVDGFADYCIVDLIRPDGGVERAAARHADNEKRTLMERVLDHPPGQNGGGAAARVIRSDAAEVERPGANGFVSAQVPVEVVDRLAPRLQVIVPLRGRESRLGAMTLGFGGDTGGLNAVDSAQAFARHAGLALERAYRFDRTVAAKEMAEQASEATAQFLANISHDFKTPLAAVIGYTEQLLGGPGQLSETVAGHLRRIRASAAHQSSLIEQMVEYARFEGRWQRVRLETVDLCAAAETAVNLMKPEAQAAGVPIRLVLPREPCIGCTDAAKLRQVLLNLLSNAVRYTESGEVRLEAAAVGEHVVFKVIDSGVGIPPEEIPRIFDRFYRCDTTRPRGRGAGLGLNIARELVVLLGGEIDVESQPGVGTSFEVRLPLTQAAAVRWARPRPVRPAGLETAHPVQVAAQNSSGSI